MKHILIVDDNAVNIYLLQTLLGSCGYEVTAAANGAEALDMARSRCPDMIIADILMPVMDGFELCRAWKADARWRHVPFIFYTATYTDAKDEQFALDLGATRFLVKPQEPEELLRIVEEVFASHAAGHATTSRNPPLEEQAYFRQYNEALIRKLEDKMLELEETNHRLELDIAERERVEANLTRLATAIEQSGEIVMVTDPTGRIQYLNPAFEKVTGYSREEALDQNSRLLHSGKQDAAFYQELWQTISSGRTWTGRMVNKRKDGKLYTEESTISPVVDATGRIINYVAVKRDVTEYLLLTEQLQQAMKMEAIGRLAGGVAHDFNNALTPLLGIISLLLMRMQPGDPCYDDIKEMEHSVERCTKLIRQLLAFSRNQPIDITTLNLNDIVANMVKMLSRLIGEDIALMTVIDPDTGNIHADAGQVEQIIANLTVNARDAMPHGGQLIIETTNVMFDAHNAHEHSLDKPGPYVMLTVRDTGIGMDPETQTHIFEPFFTTKDKGKGTGLGLSTVYGIVTQYHGSIEVVSEVGRGTTFTIYLPRVGDDVEETRRLAHTPARVDQGSETILLVEDDEGVRAVAKRMLMSQGYTVLETRNGAHALQISEEFRAPIHLMLTDVVMPDMNGKELATCVLAARPGIRVLYMSGYMDETIMPLGIRETGANYIQKPFTAESLNAKVRSVLDHG